MFVDIVGVCKVLFSRCCLAILTIFFLAGGGLLAPPDPPGLPGGAPHPPKLFPVDGSTRRRVAGELYFLRVVLGTPQALEDFDFCKKKKMTLFLVFWSFMVKIAKQHLLNSTLHTPKGGIGSKSREEMLLGQC